jgi:hypothetical protein
VPVITRDDLVKAAVFGVIGGAAWATALAIGTSIWTGVSALDPRIIAIFLIGTAASFALALALIVALDRLHGALPSQRRLRRDLDARRARVDSNQFYPRDAQGHDPNETRIDALHIDARRRRPR